MRLTKDIAEYLDENVKLNFIEKKNDTKKYKIAYHSACSMQHGQKIHYEPINLIKKTGNEVLEISDGHLCCGSRTSDLASSGFSQCGDKGRIFFLSCNEFFDPRWAIRDGHFVE